MLIRTLLPWGGLDFNLTSGDVVEVPDDVGAARIEAGLAEDATPPAKPAPTRRIA